ncbi:MAG: hypothetical protein ABI704_10090 [Kofleriaceae bacterium]
MLKHLVLAALLTACDSKKPAPAFEAPTRQNVPATPKLLLPVVAAGTARALEPPPLLIMLDGRGNVRVAAAATWGAVAKLDPVTGILVTDVEGLAGSLSIAKDHGETPAQTVQRMTNAGDTSLRIAAEEAKDNQPSGGTGTAMATANAQPSPSPDLQQQHADATGLLGDLRLFADSTGPGRRALVAGELRDVMKPSSAVVLPDPRVAAARLIDLLAETMGVIGVDRDGAIVPLRLQIYRTRQRASSTEPNVLEVHVGVTTLDPGLPALKLQIGKRDAWSPIDLLVDRDVNAGRLVETIVQLDQAGARILGLGLAR